MRHLRGSHFVPVAAALAWIALTPGSASAQLLHGGPEVGRSDIRGLAIGARIGAEALPGLDLVAQLLRFFPDEDALADPGVLVERSSWQGSLNALYTFDRNRGFAPYVGAGVRYGRAGLAVTVDGLRATDRRAGFAPNLIGGVRLPRLPGGPHVELRGGGDGGSVLTAGLRLAIQFWKHTVAAGKT